MISEKAFKVLDWFNQYDNTVPLYTWRVHTNPQTGWFYRSDFILTHPELDVVLEGQWVSVWIDNLEEDDREDIPEPDRAICTDYGETIWFYQL